MTKLLPYRIADRIAGRFAVIFCHLSKKKRGYIADNLRHIFADRPLDLEQFNVYLKNTFINFARVMIDFFRLGFLSKEEIISSVDIKGFQYTYDALSQKRGCVLMTMHLGNWDYAGACLAACGVPMSALVEETETGMLDLYTRHRERTGMQTFPLTRAAYAFLSVIKNNRVLAVLADRDILKNGSVVSFLSGKRSIPKGLAEIIIKKRLPVLFGYLVLHPDQKRYRYLGVIEPPLYFDGTVAEFNRLMVQRFERWLKDYPDQWLVFHPEWVE